MKNHLPMSKALQPMERRCWINTEMVDICGGRTRSFLFALGNDHHRSYQVVSATMAHSHDREAKQLRQHAAWI